jgi:large subunit ribosomal protein L10
MNRDQKAVAIAEIAENIDQSEAIFAVDYRGITVAQVAELRAKLRDADASFKVVKNSLTERAADQVGAEALKDFLAGPTALTFVRGDAATAAKAIADYAKATQLLPFKGGLMEGSALDVEQIRSLSRLPSREALYGQLVGIVASPISGLVRSLGGLIGGLAVALGQVQEKKASGEIPAGAPPAAAEEPVAEAAPEEPKAEEPVAENEPAAEEPTAEASADTQTASSPEGEPEADEPAQADDNQADVSAEVQPATGSAPQDTETNPTKED